MAGAAKRCSGSEAGQITGATRSFLLPATLLNLGELYFSRMDGSGERGSAWQPWQPAHRGAPRQLLAASSRVEGVEVRCVARNTCEQTMWCEQNRGAGVRPCSVEAQCCPRDAGGASRRWQR
jgi:hypothetical protein